ncbi:MAG: division/cell wall cluster transcriptional repressor MraZ [Pseudomonadota bacterium]
MSRFLSNFVMNVDRKGRVSVPAPFRAVLAQTGATELYTLKNLEHSVVDVGGAAWLDELERPLDALDPMSIEYERLSTFIHGDGAFVKLDDTGRLVLPDTVREHTGISGQVAFVGRRTFFQMWEPERFAQWRDEARSALAADRRAASGVGSGKAASA